MSATNLTGSVSFTRKVISTPGSAEQLASVLVPDGFKTTFKARADNNGSVYLATTAAAAQSSTGNRKILTPGESISEYIDNPNRFYMDAENATDVLEITLSGPNA